MREIRRAKLRQNFGFDCRCSVCLGEEVPGSPCWVTDQRKRSLIAPWSSEMAKKAMDEGWEKLCASRCTKLTPMEAIHILEPVQAVINRILDEHNIIVLLVARRLISKYTEVGECEKALKLFELVIKKSIDVLMNEYATVCYVNSIFCDVHLCLLQLGRTEESMPMAQEMYRLYPKVPSTDAVLNACHDETKVGNLKISALDNKIAAVMLEQALNSDSLCLPDGVNVDNLRKYLQYSKSGIEPPKGLKIADKTMFIPLTAMADGELIKPEPGPECGIQ